MTSAEMRFLHPGNPNEPHPPAGATQINPDSLNNDIHNITLSDYAP